MLTLRFSLPHRLLSRYGVLLLFLFGLPLATWVSFQLLVLVANHYGYDPVTSPLFSALTF
jgi:hypothetical protein